MTKDNHLLGKFELSGIAPAQRGVPQIEVSFEIDVNGILHVSAEDKGTGAKESITITNDKGRLSKEDIDRMVKEAEERADEDKEMRERVESKNQLENYVYQIRNIVTDDEKSAALDEEDKEVLNKAIEDTLEWIKDNGEADKDEFDQQYKDLEKIVQPIFTKLYSKGGAPGGPGGFEGEMPNHDEL